MVDVKEKDSLSGNEEPSEPMATQAAPRVYRLVYINILVFAYWHIGGIYGLFLGFSAKWQTILFNIIYHFLGGWGITAGAHRLWSHRAYKAKLPLQILLMLFQSSTAQSPIIYWCRDHRSHHKYTDTDADPHNSTRGFFYSHVGWLMVRRHPEVKKRGKAIDMSDLNENPVLQFQNKYYLVLSVLLTFVLPTLIPIYCWNETLNIAYHVSLFRHIITTNGTFLVNSAAHKFGYKPYDKDMSSTQNPAISLIALGEGYHNYHHVFPFDYRTSEFGNNCLNLTTKFINFFARIGWAYDMKHVSDEIIMKRAKRTGDGTDLWGRVKKDLDGEQTSLWEDKYGEISIAN